MHIDHFAVCANSEEDSDVFFIQLLGLNKIRNFHVSSNLMKEFFGIEKNQQIIRYENEDLSAEVFITGDNSSSNDLLTHQCLVVNERDEFLNRAIELGYRTTKVMREENNSYYLFIRDDYGNIYEIK
ncbi:MAG: hypothetical protein JXA99_05550 [Candidatus Lokiarchaeota archaeon]|nr:hypothetical protein [Candidatus Lokiarchaeota archaeon]